MAPTTPAPTKDRITCHVLDTAQGKPARGIRVRLELNSSSSTTTTTATGAAAVSSPSSSDSSPTKTFESQTDDDGRVKAWLPYSASNASGEVPVYTLDDVLSDLVAENHDVSRWTLRFDTAAYFAEEGGSGTFFPEVVVVFEVRPGQSYHVPLLLSPYGYTTYRGS